MLTLLWSCSDNEHVINPDPVEEEVNVTLNLDLELEDEESLSRADVVHNYEYLVIVSPDKSPKDSVASGYVGRFTTLKDLTITLKKDVQYGFFISAFESLGDDFDLSRICRETEIFRPITTKIPVSPSFPDQEINRYYGNVSQAITKNTIVKITGNRFVYGINVEIEKPNEGTLKLTSNLDGFEYEVSSSDTESLSASNIFSLGGVDLKGTKSVTLTLSYLKNNQLVSSVTKTISIERNHYKVIKVDAPDALVNFGFTIADGEEAMTPDADVELSVQTANE